MASPGDRIKKLLDLMQEEGFTGILIRSPANIFYFTGYMGPGLLLVSVDGPPILDVYPLDYELAQNTCTDQVQISQLGMGSSLKDVIESIPDSVKVKLGFDFMSAEDYLRFSEYLGSSLAPASKQVWRLRMIKDSDELEKIRKASEISSRCMELARDLIEDGVMESEVKAEVMKEMLKLGAEKAAFDIIVASGPRSSLPHGGLGDRMMKSGDVVVVDLGAVYQGYCSDMTRTFYIGSDPDDKIKEVYEVVSRAKKAAEEAAAIGVKVSELYEKSYEEIASKGYGEYYIHSLGHGVGIEIHEPPRVFRGVDEILSEGLVITIEPGVYLPGKFGVRIEDTILIRRDRIETLTSAPYDLELG